MTTPTHDALPTHFISHGGGPWPSSDSRPAATTTRRRTSPPAARAPREVVYHEDASFDGVAVSGHRGGGTAATAGARGIVKE